jgi:hypothetical protein
MVDVRHHKPTNTQHDDDDNRSTTFVVDPQHPLYHCWLGIISIGVAYNLLFIPARHSFDDFDRKLRAVWITFDYTFDIVYVVDLWLRSRTGRRTTMTLTSALSNVFSSVCSGYVNDGLVVRDHRCLRRNYLTSRQFLCSDLLSILPTDILFVVPRYRFMPIFRFNRLLRVDRLREFHELTELRTRSPHLFHFLTVICLTLTLIHW